jgi:outer membrane protein TolC
MDFLSQVTAKAAVIACGSLVAMLSVLQCSRLPAQETSAQTPLSLSMRDAIRIALSPQGDPAMGLAGESVKIAEAQFREARGVALPQVDTTISGSNQVLNLAALGLDEIHFPVPGFTFPQSVGPFNTLDARVHIRQGVFDTAVRRRAKSLQAGITTAKDQSDEARDQIAAQVARLYLAALKASSAIDLAKARVESAETTLRELTNRDAEGKSLSIDVSHARMRVESEMELLARVESNRAEADLDLLNSLNLSLDTPLNLIDPLAFSPQDMLSPAQAVTIAMKSRSEVATQKQREEAARLSQRSIHSERFPTVGVFADMGSSGTSAPGSVGVYTVGVSLNLPIFDGGQRASREAQGQASLRQDEIRERQLEKQVELEVRQALLKLDSARGQIDVSTKELDISREELNHRTRLLEQGVGGELEVADARLTLAQAEDARQAALYAWNEAHIELMQAMGTIRNLAQ